VPIKIWQSCSETKLSRFNYRKAIVCGSFKILLNGGNWRDKFFFFAKKSNFVSVLILNWLPKFHYETGLPDFSWYNIPKWGNMYQATLKYTNWPQQIPTSHKIDHMAIKSTNIFHYKAHHNLPKFGFLVWKYAIWQPCFLIIGLSLWKRKIEKINFPIQGSELLSNGWFTWLVR
jgi:hypothetical protein